MERPCGPRAKQASSGDDVVDVECHAQEARVPGKQKETIARKKDDVMIRPSVETAAPSRERRSVGLEALANPSAPKAAAFPVKRLNAHRTDSQLIDDEEQDHLSLVAAASGNDAGRSAARRSPCGGTNSDMRAQAAPPTRTAPATAKVSRQPSDGTPIWASPSAAW